MKWQISFDDLLFKKAHFPFWKLEKTVESNTREEALENLLSEMPNPSRFGNFRISKSK